MKKSFLFSLLLLLVLGSCDSNRLYEDNVEFSDRSWKVIEEPRFEFIIPDTTSQYNIYYNVRNSLEYPYARIFVTYHLYDSTGKELSRKLINNDLFDQKTGKPFGDSGLGDLFDHQFPILQKNKFNYKGKFSIKLDQLMRQDTLKGVIAIGVRVEKVSKD
ncbi:MAG: gliding motility lipoprotein GldH [Cyclobacteriaceae bacterium]|nr:gliding motility lipoprotein GldH [Cyclobacteriaceae bacterium]